MKINLLIFVSSVKEQTKQNTKFMLKSIESDIRPAKGDILDDPGFDPGYHNGYEVVKVTINYASNECYVSLQPLVLELQEIKVETYLKKLEAHGWCSVSKDELTNL